MIKSVLIDISRYRVPLPDRMKTMLNRLSKSGFQQVFFNIEHALNLESFPEIGSYSDSYDKDEIMDIVNYAESLNLEIIPVYQSCGHMFHTLKWNKYRYLSETDKLWSVSLTSETLTFFDKVYNEISHYFKSDFIHVGGDEVYDLAEGKTGNTLDENNDKYDLYFDYILELRKIAASYGKKIMIWGDLIQKKPELLNHLPDDITVCYWMYDFDKIPEFYKRLTGKFYMCPGLQTWKSEFFRIEYMKTNISIKSEEADIFKPYGLMLTDWGDGGHLHSPVVSELLANYALNLFCDRNFRNGLTGKPELEDFLLEIDNIHFAGYLNSELVNNRPEFVTRMLYMEYPITGKGFNYQTTKQLENLLARIDRLKSFKLEFDDPEMEDYIKLILKRTEVLTLKTKINLKFRNNEGILDTDIANLLKTAREAHILLTKTWLKTSKPMGLFYHNHFHNIMEKAVTADYNLYLERGSYEKMNERHIYDLKGVRNQFSVGNYKALQELWSDFV
ncbi:MAG: family 20 glycosylhydrolase [Candidatus Delongbacteria bacterium]|nr:family 20 glycosylhydrolase [Candidatus Delongbacteria bacterium]MBN2836621.1 family 20 glycosylhydrolase [Candidatus Delongbacteria bacterium]